MKKKRIIILVLQIAIVIGSLFAINSYTNSRVALDDAYIYRSSIGDRPITEDDIQKVSVPREALNNDIVKDPEEIIGKYVDGKVSSGQYIYGAQLINKEDIDVFESMDLSKYRKISLPISYEEAFAGNIKRGDSIDLMYVGQGQAEDDTGGGGFNYSKVFMQDILVYSVNTGDGYKFIDRSSKVDSDIYYDETISTEADVSGDLAIITLAVTLDEAEQIQARLKSGHVNFVGRFNESDSYNTLGYVMGDYGKIFSGKGFAETDNLMIVEDDFDVIDLDALEEFLNEKEENEKEDENEEDIILEELDDN